MAKVQIIQTLNTPTPPAADGQHARWGQLYGSSYSLAMAAACIHHNGPVLLIAESVHNAAKLELELRFFLQGLDIAVHAFPDWETLPYDSFSPHQDSISQRLLALYTLPKLQTGVLVIAAQTLMQRVAPAHYIAQHVFQLQTGAKLNLDAFREQVVAGGYQSVSQVMEHGEFAIRGSIIDIYPMGSNAPLRIDLFDEEIESIRSFDPSNQRSIKKLDSVRLLPAREFPLTANGIRLFRTQYRDRFSGNPQNNPIYSDVSNGIAPSGCEYYLPLFFEQTQTLFDYLPAGTLCLFETACSDMLENFWQETNHRYEQLRHNIERPILSPTELYLHPDELDAQLAILPSIEFQQLKLDSVAAPFEYNFASSQPPALNLETRLEQPSARLHRFVQEFKGRILFVCESAGRREVLLDLLRNLKIHAAAFSDWRTFSESSEPVGITIGPLENGLLLENQSGSSLTVITEEQIFGLRAQQRRRRKTRARDADLIINSLTELNINAPVVHEEHGVGRYLGLEIIKVADVETEFLVLEYADGDKLYVPVTSLDLINRYTGASAETAPLHRLGGEQWQRIKRKAAKQIRDVAAELLDLYARRAARSGFAFKSDISEMYAFSQAFPFEETPDQQTAIDAVLEDMAHAKPMDRVVCGDVGFGKTEVAMRATFAAVQNNKQVAILVPTTLLAQQHFQNFQDRFADWPIQVKCLSRFNAAGEQKIILDAMKSGKVDVVIGTHKLLQKGIEFKDLGLIIVDEEHRFGVRHKEILKSLRAEVDVLTLTATPIPRTLNMSLSGLRDLSIIATPPERRNAIKTFVTEWRDDLILEACHRELMRGGQIYFVHNEVKNIEHIAEKLTTLLPEARIAIAHGQLPERELENIMLDFYHQRFNILLCTTIIESGIDVPTANTIIINRADRFGLAQLHQLRGRVGRSHHRAYAYLFSPPPKAMTTDARKRLEAIESLEDLGAGFTLASHDLEIRGAGELLGEEQSGQIHEIGYTMYTELLKRAIDSLKQGKEPLLDVPLHSGIEIDLGVAALLPADYIYDVDSRLVLYKRISNAETLDDLRELQVELIDRFGLLPQAAKNLFAQTELKIKISSLGVAKIKGNLQSGIIVFTDQPRISTVQLIKLIQFQPDRYQFDGKKTLSFKHECNTIDQQLDFLNNLLLTRLAEQKAA
ncbi:MAG: transcription-repair coupling factor [Gammaproteobacteria bacterium]|nr:transcription-repair coupling factor [Gammaproteobacteria bacterium]